MTLPAPQAAPGRRPLHLSASCSLPWHDWLGIILPVLANLLVTTAVDAPAFPLIASSPVTSFTLSLQGTPPRPHLVPQHPPSCYRSLYNAIEHQRRGSGNFQSIPFGPAIFLSLGRTELRSLRRTSLHRFSDQCELVGKPQV
jgi:hypothetical protein